jgi:hypothetical protein
MLRLKVLRSSSRRLSDDLDVMDHPDLRPFVVVEGDAAISGESAYLVDRCENIAQP